MTTVGLSASSIAGLVSSREISAETVMADHLGAAEDNAELNAFTQLDPQRALDAARHVDGLVADGWTGALAGVPIALKDIVDEDGSVTTCGSSFYRHRADRDAPAVARLKSAGGVVIGRTGLHEFAFGFSSENDHFGPVRNPWNLHTSPGGSSGGSATAVAAGIAPIGIGTDTGGSVRVPAAMCGLVGLKVTHGRIPLSGVFPLAASLDTVGPLAWSVADAGLAYAAMAGHDPTDAWSSPRPVNTAESRFEASSVRIGIPHPWVDRPLASEVATAFDGAVDALADAGISVVHLDLARLDRESQPRAAYAEVGTVHRRWFEEDRSRYGVGIRDRLEGDLQHTADEVTEAYQWRAGMRHEAQHAFKSVDFLMTPTTASREKVIGEECLDAGAGLESYRPALSWFTTLVNQLGVPAIAMPLNDGLTGPPVSLQLIAPWWGEVDLLGVGHLLDTIGVTAYRRPEPTV